MFLHKVPHPHLPKSQVSMSKSTASLGFLRWLKKSTVAGGKELKLPMIRHYDYRFLQEYQFSPSTRNAAPLLRYRSIKRRAAPAMEKKKWSCRDLCSALLSACLRPRFPEGGAGGGHSSPSPDISVAAGDQLLMLERLGGDVCCDSVDQRAERFIEKFYEEMRRQRRESIVG